MQVNITKLKNAICPANDTFHSKHLYFMKFYPYFEKPHQPEQLIPY